VTCPVGGRKGDQGVATVWSAAAVAVLIMVLVGALDVVGAVAARHRAEAAADLAALTAAAQAARGTTMACARAADVAAGSGGRVVLCRLQGWEAVVEVELAAPTVLVRAGRARGRARAGPAAARPPVPVLPSRRDDAHTP
jgi:secretion/DNA translocation related TadE-like protein